MSGFCFWDDDVAFGQHVNAKVARERLTSSPVKAFPIFMNLLQVRIWASRRPFIRDEKDGAGRQSDGQPSAYAN
jgi:hypothetical protein